SQARAPHPPVRPTVRRDGRRRSDPRRQGRSGLPLDRTGRGLRLRLQSRKDRPRLRRIGLPRQHRRGQADLRVRGLRTLPARRPLSPPTFWFRRRGRFFRLLWADQTELQRVANTFGSPKCQIALAAHETRKSVPADATVFAELIEAPAARLRRPDRRSKLLRQ